MFESFENRQDPWGASADRLIVEVPWDQADWLRDRLARAGIRATACFEPYDRAYLELPARARLDRVKPLLEEYAAAQAA